MAKLQVTQFALSTAAAGSTQTVEIASFGTPTAAIFIHTEADTNGTAATTTRFSVGFTDGVRESCCAILAQDNAGNSAVARSMTTSACIAGVNGTAGVVFSFSFNSWSANGVVLDIDTANAEAELVTLILIQADDEYAGTIALGTGTSAIDITAPNFEPDLVFFASVGISGTLPAADQILNPAFGVWVNDGSDTQRSVYSYQADNTATMAVYSAIYNTYGIGQIGAGSLTYGITVGGADPQGFSVTPSASAGSDHCAYLALKLTGLNVSLFDLSIPTTGNYAETTPAFTPNFGLIAAVAGPSSRNTVSTVDTTIAVTAFDASSIYTASFSSDNGPTISVEESYADNTLAFLKGDSSGLAVDSSGYAFDADGWDFTLTTNPASAVLGWGLAIGAGATAAAGIRNPLGGPMVLRNPLGRM